MKRPSGAELPQLRGGVGEGRAVAAAAAMEDEDVALGVDRDARGLAHVEIGRQLEEIRHRVVGDQRGRRLRRLLRQGGRAKQHENGEQKSFHCGSSLDGFSSVYIASARAGTARTATPEPRMAMDAPAKEIEADQGRHRRLGSRHRHGGACPGDLAGQIVLRRLDRVRRRARTRMSRWSMPPCRACCR